MLRLIRKINILLLILLVLQTLGVFGNNPETASATTTPFLYRPYYGAFPGWTSIVDHEYPDVYYPDNVFTRYNGQRWVGNVGFDNCTTSLNCYDSHTGIDFKLTYEPVVAPTSGSIEYAGWVSGNHETDYGLYIRMYHAPNYNTYYAHLSAIRYQTGSNVERWQIGTSGTTGNSSGPHLHFEVRRNDGNGYRVTDPYGWSGSYPDPWAQRNNGISSEWLWVSDPLQSPPSYYGDTYVDDGWTKFSKGCQTSNCPYWWTVTGMGYDGDFLWTYANGINSPDYWAKWQPDLPSIGQYEVEVHIPPWTSQNQTHAARYEIQHANGTNTVVVDQHRVSDGTGHWISLGRYNFNQGISGYVKVTDATGVGNYDEPPNMNKKVLVDAVRWRRTHP